MTKQLFLYEALAIMPSKQKRQQNFLATKLWKWIFPNLIPNVCRKLHLRVKHTTIKKMYKTN